MEYINVFAKYAENIINEISVIDKRYCTNQKNSTFNYIKTLLNFIRNNTYWSRFSEISDSNWTINGKLLNGVHNTYCKKGYYEKILERTTEMYFEHKNCTKLKFQSSDTMFIKNKFGVDMVDRNKYYKNKNGIKISNIIDKTGVQIAISFAIGSESDSRILFDTLDNQIIDPKTENYIDSNRFKQYMLLDKGYDTQKIKKTLEDRCYNPIIGRNSRNTKDASKIIHFSEQDAEHYKNRIVNEHTFSWMTQYPILNAQYQKKIESFAGLYLLASSFNVFVKCKKEEKQRKESAAEKQLRCDKEQRKKEAAKERQKKKKEEKELVKMIREREKLQAKLDKKQIDRKMSTIKIKLNNKRLKQINLCEGRYYRKINSLKKHININASKKKSIVDMTKKVSDKIKELHIIKINKINKINKTHDDDLNKKHEAYKTEKMEITNQIDEINAKIMKSKKSVKMKYLPKFNQNKTMQRHDSSCIPENVS